MRFAMLSTLDRLLGRSVKRCTKCGARLSCEALCWDGYVCLNCVESYKATEI